MISARTMFVLTLSVVTALAACGKKEDDVGSASASGGAAATASKSAEPAKMTWKKIDHMGLEIEAPETATIEDTSADAPNAMISAGDLTFTVSTVTGAFDSSFDAAKRSIQKNPNTFQSFSKEEQTDGGWQLEYELESMMNKSPLYGVQIRTTIDGKEYECGRNDPSKDAIAHIAKLCRTLRKAQ